jgi:hypothetical protein
MRFGACASRSGPRPGILPADRVRLTRPWHFLAPGPSRRVPSDTGCGARASAEGGQRDSPIRPAARVGSRRAHRDIRRQDESAVGSAMATARLPVHSRVDVCASRRLDTPGALRAACHRLCAASKTQGDVVHAWNPHPPPGGEEVRTGPLPGLPGRRTQCPKGHVAMGRDRVRATGGLAEPDPQEKCLGLGPDRDAQAPERKLTRLPSGTHAGSLPRCRRRHSQTWKKEKPAALKQLRASRSLPHVGSASIVARGRGTLHVAVQHVPAGTGIRAPARSPGPGNCPC